MKYRISYSKHAKFQMRERNISEALVKRVVDGPDQVADRSDGTIIAQKEVRWRSRMVLCRVVYRHTSREAIRIITAYITTKIKKYR